METIQEVLIDILLVSFFCGWYQLDPYESMSAILSYKDYSEFCPTTE